MSAASIRSIVHILCQGRVSLIALGSETLIFMCNTPFTRLLISILEYTLTAGFPQKGWLNGYFRNIVQFGYTVMGCSSNDDRYMTLTVGYK